MSCFSVPLRSMELFREEFVEDRDVEFEDPSQLLGGGVVSEVEVFCQLDSFVWG